MYKLSLAFVANFVFFSLVFAEVDASKLPKHKQTTLGLYLTAAEAYELKKNHGDEVLLIDVRTRSELEFVGSTNMIDANIPYVFNEIDEFDSKKKRFKKTPNSNFTVAVEDVLTNANLGKDTKILLMCRSGSRSARATDLLHKLNYSNVYTVVDGFEGDKAKEGKDKGKRVVNGWKNSGLPWGYKLEEKKMYME